MPPSRREELVDAAMRVFYRNGFHGTGLDLVLKESGISRMTLYNHFKSKDELIVAALRRRDELFRNALMKRAERDSADPRDRIIAIFDYLDEWFNADDFQGCMFINVSAEYCDADAPARKIAADHKIMITKYIQDLCSQAGYANPEELSEEITVLIEGAIVIAHVVCQSNEDRYPLSEAAMRSKRMCATLLDRAPSKGT